MSGAIGKVHTALETNREVLGCPSFRILLVEAKFEVLQPLNLFVAVVLGTFGGNDILDQNTAILDLCRKLPNLWSRSERQLCAA